MTKRGKCGQEDSELTFSHRHSKITNIYRAVIEKNDLRTGRKDFPQLKI